MSLEVEIEMLKSLSRLIGCLLGMLMSVTLVFAGGVDPKEIPSAPPVVREKISATPAQTSTAVSKARSAVASEVEEVQVSPTRPAAQSSVSKDSWMLRTSGDGCAPLSEVNRQVKNIGTFKTPQEFARQMQKRGFQAFVMDIGDTRDQVIRVKVPDQSLDLTFVKGGLCR